MVKIALLFILVAFFMACSTKEGVAGKSGDGVGPVIKIDSIFSGNKSIQDSGVTEVDTVKLQIKVTDPSGVEFVSAVAGNLRREYAQKIKGNDSLWQVTLFLAPGMNLITVTAEDEGDNPSSASSRVFFNTNYLPIDNNSKWLFVRGLDTLSIESDSSYQLGAAPYNFFRVKFFNPKFLTLESDYSIKDTLFFAQSKSDSLFRVDTSDYSAAQKGDTLFYKLYNSGVSNSKSRYIGDTIFVNQLTSVKYSYRNCVQVTVKDTAKQIAGISDYYLAPGKGFVAVKVQSRAVYINVPSLSKHPSK